MVITQEQEQERKHYIGASEIAAIAGLSPYENSASIYAMKVLGATKRKTTAMQQGLDYEPFLIQFGSSQIEKRLGERVNAVEENPEFSLDEENEPPIVCHLDGLVHLGDGSRVVLEAKTTRMMEAYGKPWTDEIPPSVLCQVTAQMALSETTKAFVVVMTREAKVNMYEVDFDKDIWKELIDRCRKFWFENVMQKVKPDGSVSLELMERIDRHDEDCALELEGESAQQFVDAITAWEQAKVEANQTKKVVEAAKADLLEQMRNYSIVRAGKATAHFPSKGRKVLKVSWEV